MPGIRWAQAPSEKTVTLDVRDYIQEPNKCGPAALAALADYWQRQGGIKNAPSEQEISSKIFSHSARGVLGTDLYHYALEMGLYATHHPSSTSELRKSLDAGEPVIILVDYGFGTYQLNHFMAVSGYYEKGFVLNSGKGLKYLRDEELQRIWARAGNWALEARPYTPGDHISRGLELEPAGRIDEALMHYRLALTGTPEAHLYLANIYYSQGDLNMAQEHYEKSIAQTSNPKAMNNLAWMLYEQDKDLSRALELALRATRIEPDSANFADTLEKVAAKVCADESKPQLCAGMPDK